MTFLGLIVHVLYVYDIRMIHVLALFLFIACQEEAPLTCDYDGEAETPLMLQMVVTAVLVMKKMGILR